MPGFTRAIPGRRRHKARCRSCRIIPHPAERQQHSDRLRKHDIFRWITKSRSENTAVRAHTGAATRMSRTQGNVDLESGSGDLRLARLTGEMHSRQARNVKDAIFRPAKVKAAAAILNRGMARATSISARARHITVSGINGGFRAKRQRRHPRQRAAKNMERAHRFGNVTLNVPSDAAFDVDISSSSGSVTLAIL